MLTEQTIEMVFNKNIKLVEKRKKLIDIRRKKITIPVFVLVICCTVWCIALYIKPELLMNGNSWTIFIASYMMLSLLSSLGFTYMRTGMTLATGVLSLLGVVMLFMALFSAAGRTDAIRISSGDELNLLRKQGMFNFELTNDIEVDDFAKADIGVLLGNFNGKGHSIVVKASESSRGLVKYNLGSITDLSVKYSATGHNSAICKINLGEIKKVEVEGLRMDKTQECAVICEKNSDTIDSCRITRCISYNGICIDNKETVENCEIDDCVLVTSGICAINNGVVKNCNTSESTKIGGEAVKLCGGIVRENAVCGEISHCVNKADVNGEAIGGITGENKGAIERCSNYGKIDGSKAGGISYCHGAYASDEGADAVISNCLNAGEIVRDGSCGIAYEATNRYGTIENTVNVDRGSYTKIVSIVPGSPEYMVVKNTYYIRNKDAEESAGTELTVKESKMMKSYEGLDFTTIWNIEKDGTPYLR